MFISVLDLFKPGIGPSSSHTNGPMVAAKTFRQKILSLDLSEGSRVRCILKGSLAHTGIGHGTDKAVILGMNDYAPEELAEQDLPTLVATLSNRRSIFLENRAQVAFEPKKDIVFDKEEPLSQHPNGMIFEVTDSTGNLLLSETYFSIGGGFIATLDEICSVEAPIKLLPSQAYPFPFDTAKSMLAMAASSGKTIAGMKRDNELALSEDRFQTERQLVNCLASIWCAMNDCIDRGLQAEGCLPGGLNIKRRSKGLYDSLQEQGLKENMNEWLCAYAMAVNEENAAGHAVVTAPTNGAAGVIPAVLRYFLVNDNGDPAKVEDFLLTAAAIGGLIKHRSSISGAEVGCQGEVGSAAAMAAAGLCAVKGGSPKQVENAAEIALEHHLGMTCDPVNGLVQVPCIERNGFGAIKAYTSAALALKGSGEHFMPLDSCIEAMKQTGLEMSEKYKETALGGLAQSWTEC